MPKIGSIGIPELLIILVVVLLIFGPRRLPDMAKGLGQSVREFRKGLRDMRKEFDDESGDVDGKGDGKAPANGPAAVSAAAANTSAAAPSAPPPVGVTPAVGSGPPASDVADRVDAASDDNVESSAVDTDRKA